MYNERIFIGLGSNLGNKQDHLKHAVLKLQSEVGRISASSRLWESPALGFRGKSFLNQVVELSSDLQPNALLRRLRQIEEESGRVHGLYGYHNRPLDLDVLLFGNRQLNTQVLRLPHPGITKRRFVLEPLAQVAPGLRIPGFSERIEELIQKCPDKSPGAWL